MILSSAWQKRSGAAVLRVHVGLALLVAMAGIVLVSSAKTGASPGTTERVSLDSAGSQANNGSDCGAISGDGRYVAFTSPATNLVAGDTNNSWDVFVRDRQAGTTERVSVDSAGNQAGDNSWSCPAISTDGRYIAFSSKASNLVDGDTNGASDVFVRDRQTGTTERVSVDSAGNQGNGGSGFFLGLAISGDGRYVAFYSGASNLVAGDTNSASDTFVHDRQTGVTERVSVDSAGNQGNEASGWWSNISADGRYVAFESGATNLVPGDTNGAFDTFVHDRHTGVTELVSVNSAGNQGNSRSQCPTISADGRYVAFHSSAFNLVPEDTNGVEDIFLHDRETGATTRMSVDSAGNQANGASYLARIADDRYVAFESYATNLVPEDTNGTLDVFVHDRYTGVTELVSVNSAGNQGNGYSSDAAIRPGGRYVAFSSFATNLVEGDTNGWPDIFLHDRSEPTPTPTPTPVPVGGTAELTDVPDSSTANYVALAALAAAGALALAAGAWYVGRRRLR